MYIVLIFLTIFVQESFLLQMMRVTVPRYKLRGQSAQLECDFKLDGHELYAVKWYRDHEEFYRYVPKLHPIKFAYKLEGIKVNLSNSDARQVTLDQVILKTSGVYGCEVSAESPRFASVDGEGRMDVIYLPKERPRITGNQVENRKGDAVFLNCTSGKSYPAAILSWDINGQKVTDPDLLIEYPPIIHAHGLVSTALGLRVPGGKTMEVRCVAMLPPAWREGIEAVVSGSHLAGIKEAMLLVRSSGSTMGLSKTLLAFFVLFWLQRNCPALPSPLLPKTT